MQPEQLTNESESTPRRHLVEPTSAEVIWKKLFQLFTSSREERSLVVKEVLKSGFRTRIPKWLK